MTEPPRRGLRVSVASPEVALVAPLLINEVIPANRHNLASKPV